MFSCYPQERDVNPCLVVTHKKRRKSMFSCYPQKRDVNPCLVVTHKKRRKSMFSCYPQERDVNPCLVVTHKKRRRWRPKTRSNNKLIKCINATRILALAGSQTFCKPGTGFYQFELVPESPIQICQPVQNLCSPSPGVLHLCMVAMDWIWLKYLGTSSEACYTYDFRSP